jgi:hypothetical protein
LAEFNLQAETVLRINGEEYSKDTILKVLQELKGLNNLRVHEAIYTHPEVLGFLENPLANVNTYEHITEFCEQVKEKDYYSEFQPLLLGALELRLKKYLNQGQYQEYPKLTVLYNYLTVSGICQLHETARRHLFSLKELTEKFLNTPVIAINLSVKITSDFAFLFKRSFIDFFNQLSADSETEQAELLEVLCRLVYFCRENSSIQLYIQLEMLESLLKIWHMDAETRKWLEWYKKEIIKRMYSIKTDVAPHEHTMVYNREKGQEMREAAQENKREPSGSGAGMNEEDDNYSPSALGQLRGAMTSRKAMKQAGIVIVISGSLSFLLWNDNRFAAVLFLVLAVTVFIAFIVLPKNSR